MARKPHITCAAILAGGALSLAVSVAGDNDLRDLKVGMSVNDIPVGDYIDFACAAAPGQTVAAWTEFRRCPPDAGGLHAVSFRFNESRNALAQVNDKYEGTKVTGHPVVLSLAIDSGGTVDRLRIDTDPKARLFLRKKAHLLALLVKTRYGEDGWDCRNADPEGATPVGGLLVNEHCEKSAPGRRLILDRAVYRRPGQSMNDFVNETHLEIRRAE
jgi:hypothetical protein